MRSRGLVLVVALVVAAAAAGAVYLYTESVRREAKAGVQVIVSRQDIAAGTQLDPLIEENQFALVEVPEDLVVEGAVLNVEQLRGRATATPIVAGEQIVGSRLSGGEEIEGGRLGIQDGYQALTVRLEAQRTLGNTLQVGDRVTLYVSFSGANVSQGSLRGVTQGTLQGPGQDQQVFQGDVTVPLVQDVRVLSVQHPTQRTPTGEETTPAAGETFVTLELLPQDVADTILSMEFGSVWMSLLPPDGEPTRHDGSTIGRVILEGVRGQS